ncbi:MAG: LuxR family transcriptional regulator [Deltaproteobacteria bacterium]|nr:LuxR family transcriptional regulator [Deltaproteobacteria bacterium]
MNSVKKTTNSAHLAHVRGRLIENIYSTVADPGNWGPLIRELVTSTDSRSARLLVMNPDANRVISSTKYNIDDHYHRQYVDHYVNACPWRTELLRKKRGRLYSTYLHFSCRQPDFLRTEFYNDWARPQDIHHGVCGTIYQDCGRTVQLLIQRTGDQGYYTETDTAFFNGLVPHLQHAFQLAGQVAESRARAEAIEIAARNELMPFILLDFLLRPIYCNAGAEVLIKTESTLSIQKEQLQLADREDNLCLQRLLQKCLAAADSRDFHTTGEMMEVPRLDGPNLQLWVKPVHPDVPILSGKPAGYVAVYIYDPKLEIPIDQERLVELYALSKAEIRVAIAMLATPDPAEVARRCCLSRHTVRSHLKAIFSKTDTKNQADLVKQLLAGPARRR